MTNQNLFPDLEHSKLIAPIMEGVEPDGYWYRTWQSDALEGPEFTEWYFLEELRPLYRGMETETVPAYRLDKILARLPEWCFKIFLEMTYGDYLFPTGIFYQVVCADNKIPKSKLFKLARGGLYKMITNIFSERGQAQLHAACELLVLLDKENLL